MARILVIDDQPDVARAIARMLRTHEIVAETNPRHAVDRIIDGEQFDMVLVDFEMPHMNGRDVSDALTEALLTQPPIVLIMSGSENVASMFETGRGVLLKPLKGDDLRNLVSELLHDHAALSHHHADA
jgi:CheY-like chemotaxis protein